MRSVETATLKHHTFTSNLTIFTFAVTLFNERLFIAHLVKKYSLHVALDIAEFDLKSEHYNKE